MSKNRFSARTDSNQKPIVEALRELPCLSVETDHDDIFVGYKGFNYWYELKTDEAISKRTGKIKESSKRKSQKKLEKNWKGHYKIVSSFDEILNDIGIIR